MTLRPRDRLIAATANFVARRPIGTLVVALLFAAASVFVTCAKLEFQADRNELIDPALDWNRRFAAYQKQFSGDDDLIVVVQVPDAPGGAERARAMVREIAERLTSEQASIESVVWGFDEGKTRPAALRMLPLGQFEEHLAEIRSSATLLAARDLTSLLSGPGDSRPDESAAAIGGGAAMAPVLLGLLSGKAVSKAAPGASPDPAAWHYLESEDSRLLFVRVRPRLVPGVLDDTAAAVARARDVIDAARARHPGIEAGLSGVTVVEADETRISMEDSTWCSIASIAGITALLMLAHHGWRLTLIALASLLIGVAWTFGFLTLAIGHLQILSVAFTSILLGLGIDYAIYLGTRYESLRVAYPPGPEGFRSAFFETLRNTGPGVITGCLTPALAFGTMLLTRFRGMAEMGLIAGVGIILCLVASLTAFPAMIRLFMPDPAHVTGVETRGLRFFDARWFMPFVRHPGATLAGTAVVILAAAPTMLGLKYDYNLMHLQADGSSSVRWQSVILAHDAEAVWGAASIAPDMAAARERSEQFRKLPTVASVGGVGLLFPPDEPRKLALLEKAEAVLSPLLDAPESRPPAPSPAKLRAALSELAVQMKAADSRESGGADAAAGGLAEKVAGAAASLEVLPPLAAQVLAATIHSAFLDWQDGVRKQVRAALDRGPLTIEDLPEAIRSDFVGNDGRLLLKVFPRGDAWEPEVMERFAAELRTVDPEVTGPPIQISQAALLIKNSYAWAGAYAFIVVFLILWLDFRNVVDALLAIFPVTIGFVVTFAVMLLARVDVNPANIIILPVLFGIGVESGVHMLHRNRLHPEDQPPGLSAGTGKGVVLATLTTIMGFGSMMLARHRGIQSLGFVVSVGMATILVVCLTVMPVMLLMRGRARRRRRQGPATE